jgi:hypothetical protein
MRIKKQIERWFEVPDDPDKAQIQVKHLNPGEVADIMDGVFKQTIVYRTDDDGDSQPELTQETDKRKDREMTLTASVVNWKKFFDKDGKKLECTPENVIRASREIEGFDSLVTDFRNRLLIDIQGEEVKEDKELKANL